MDSAARASLNSDFKTKTTTKCEVVKAKKIQQNPVWRRLVLQLLRGEKGKQRADHQDDNDHEKEEVQRQIPARKYHQGDKNRSWPRFADCQLGSIRFFLFHIHPFAGANQENYAD